MRKKKSLFVFFCLCAAFSLSLPLACGKRPAVSQTGAVSPSPAVKGVARPLNPKKKKPLSQKKPENAAKKSRPNPEKTGQQPNGALPSNGALQSSASPEMSPPGKSVLNSNGLPDLSRLAEIAKSPSPTATPAPQKKAPPPPAREAQPLSPAQQLLSVSPYDYLYPEDFSLGSLAPRYPQGADRSLSEASWNFLNNLKVKKLEAAGVDPESLPVVQDALFYYFKKQKETVSSFRVGSFSKDGDRAQASVYLYADKARASGEIDLLRTDKGWLVESFEADFPSLSKPREDAKGQYEPEEYKVFFP
jgi:hypothetical protein